MLYAAAVMLALTGVAHSVLGERFILVRLFRRDDLPKLFGGVAFTVRTLRFAWHLTTVLMFCLAAVLVLISGDVSVSDLAVTIGVALLVSGLLPLVHTRGRHLSWVVFFVAGGLCLWWAAG